jgi:hypothetical protein
VTGTTGETYARTGYLGFLKRTESVSSDGGMYSSGFLSKHISRVFKHAVLGVKNPSIIYDPPSLEYLCIMTLLFYAIRSIISRLLCAALRSRLRSCFLFLEVVSIVCENDNRVVESYIHHAIQQAHQPRPCPSNISTVAIKI